MMKNEKLISVEGMWEDFSTHVLVGVRPGSIQYKESRKVFYSAVGVTILNLRNILGDKKVSMGEAIINLQEIIAEVEAEFKRLEDEYNAVQNH